MSPIEVYVRLRPPSFNEQSALEPELSVTQDERSQSISLSPRSCSKETPNWCSGAPFAKLFTGSVTNDQIYEETIKSSLARVMEGATCNLFAYGHSGSGKTHTIIGYDYEDIQHVGLFLSAARDLFRVIDEENTSVGAGHDKERLGVAVRLYEVRGKSAFDLLNNGVECHIRQGADGRTHVRGKTEILEHGKVRVCPIVAKPVWSYDELRQAVLAGLKMREVGSSSVHTESSRTHAFIEFEIINKALLEARNLVIERESELVPIGRKATDVYIEEQMKSLIKGDDGQFAQNPNRPLNQAKIDAAEAEKNLHEIRLEEAENSVNKCFQTSVHRCLGGKFVFVDLAGSEYFDSATKGGGDHIKQTTQERRQGRQINTDLFALKEVMRAKSSNQARVPFRSSPLTMVLRSHFERSISGSSSIILTISPLESQLAATKNTLRYGSLISGK